MTDSIDVISEATGIPRGAMLTIWETVKTNQSLLDSCIKHDFHAVEPGKIGTKYVCGRCKGSVNAPAVLWYKRGLEHFSADLGKLS